VLTAAERLREKIVAIAARALEAAPQDIVLSGGQAAVRGSPGRALTFEEIARAGVVAGTIAHRSHPGLEAATWFMMPQMTVPSGAHAAVVEVDREIGRVRVLRYVAVDDCGRVINPLLVEGQIHGSLAQGLGQALFEEAAYSGDGQLLTGSLLDYTVPTAADLPEFLCESRESPSPLNPLGAKGIGESGTIGAPPAIVNAVEDALRPDGIAPLQLPLTPDRVWTALQAARGRGRRSRAAEV